MTAAWVKALPPEVLVACEAVLVQELVIMAGHRPVAQARARLYVLDKAVAVVSRAMGCPLKAIITAGVAAERRSKGSL